MRLILLPLLLGLSLFVSPVRAAEPALGGAVAVAYDSPQASAEALLKLPTVYVMPGSWLYWLKHLVEQIQLALTTDPKSRSSLLLDLSQQRLAEGYQAMKAGDWSSAMNSFEEYQRDQQQLSGILSTLQQQKVDVGSLLNRLKQQLNAQQALLLKARSAPAYYYDQLAAVLQIQAEQTLALSNQEQGALLGISTHQSSTVSAVQSTNSATPQPKN